MERIVMLEEQSFVIQLINHLSKNEKKGTNANLYDNHVFDFKNNSINFTKKLALLNKEIYFHLEQN